jgi:histidine triad (HIT) family protein
MSDCIFCKILKGDIPSTKVFENDKVYGFKDLHPQAQTHLLFIHKNHSKNINEMSGSPSDLADVFQAINAYTIESKLAETGFRVVTNHGKHAGQTVFHTHFHVLGGESLGHFGR